MTTTKPVRANVLECIGDTPLIALSGVVPEGCARILVKLESQNPTGSMKDRMALAMINAAEHSGRLKPQQRVVEYTGGSTGVSLAMICATKKYPLSIVTSDAFSQEKRDHMAAFGAELTVVPSNEGRMDEALTRTMIEQARIITEKFDGYWTDQLSNADQLPAYNKMADEIWKQTNGKLDAFVSMTGTAACFRGNTETLHGYNPSIHCVAVEPAESPVFSQGISGAHKIEGAGAGFVVPLWKPEVADQIVTVSTEQAMGMCRQLAATEGLFAGTSTGANVLAAIDVGLTLGPSATVVTIMCDSGIKYLSTALYAGQPSTNREQKP